jgi:hypothetical protein
MGKTDSIVQRKRRIVVLFHFCAEIESGGIIYTFHKDGGASTLSEALAQFLDRDGTGKLLETIGQADQSLLVLYGGGNYLDKNKLEARADFEAFCKLYVIHPDLINNLQCSDLAGAASNTSLASPRLSGAMTPRFQQTSGA